jgi:hypothetical protein
VAVTYQTGQIMGLQANGYAAAMDDTQPLVYLGVYKGLHQVVSTTDPPGLLNLVRIDKCPIGLPLQALSLTPLASRFSNSTTSGGGAIGKVAYAWDAGSCTLDPSNLTYANQIGIVRDVLYASNSLLNQGPANMTSIQVQIEPLLDRHGDKNAGVRLVSGTTGTQLWWTDVGKKIICPAIANLTLTLPPGNLCALGDSFDFIKNNSNSPVGEITIAANGTDQINGAGTSNVGLSSAWSTATATLCNANGWILH